MATSEEVNLQQFRDIHDSVTPGKEGVKFDGDLYRQAKHANIHAESAKNASEALLDRLAAGKTGVRFEGDLYGILRRTEYNTAITTQLVSALKAVAGGEAFDEAKLLAGVEAAAKAGAEAGTAAAIQNIDTTVTIKQEETK